MTKECKKYALFWKGKQLKDLGTFNNKSQAETTRHLETQQMELAEYSPSELNKWFKVKRLKKC